MLRRTAGAIVRTVRPDRTARPGAVISVAGPVVPVARFCVWTVMAIRLAGTVVSVARFFGALSGLLAGTAVVVLLMSLAVVARTRRGLLRARRLAPALIASSCF